MLFGRLFLKGDSGCYYIEFYFFESEFQLGGL